jgi:hypothetical protein
MTTPCTGSAGSSASAVAIGPLPGITSISSSGPGAVVGPSTNAGCSSGTREAAWSRSSSDRSTST